MREVGLRLTAALRTNLHRDAVAMAGLDHRLAFGDRAAGGFFHIHMLAAFRGVHGLHGVQVVGRRNDDRIDVAAIQHIAVVAIHVRLRPGVRDAASSRLLVHVADGRDIRFPAVHQRLDLLEMVSAHAADADEPERQPLIGSRPAPPPGRPTG